MRFIAPVLVIGFLLGYHGLGDRVSKLPTLGYAGLFAFAVALAGAEWAIAEAEIESRRKE